MSADSNPTSPYRRLSPEEIQQALARPERPHPRARLYAIGRRDPVVHACIKAFELGQYATFEEMLADLCVHLVEQNRRLLDALTTTQLLATQPIIIEDTAPRQGGIA